MNLSAVAEKCFIMQKCNFSFKRFYLTSTMQKHWHREKKSLKNVKLVALLQTIANSFRYDLLFMLQRKFYLTHKTKNEHNVNLSWFDEIDKDLHSILWEKPSQRSQGKGIKELCHEKVANAFKVFALNHKTFFHIFHPITHFKTDSLKWKGRWILTCRLV